MSERDQVAAWTILELLRCLETPPHDPRPIVSLTLSVDLVFALGVDGLIEDLLNHNEQRWAILLSRLSGRYRFLSFFPREGFRVDTSRGQRIDLFERFKRLSPFAEAELIFESADRAAVCEKILHAHGWCSDHDEFVFVLQQTPEGSALRPIWIRPRAGSLGADVREGPLVTVGANINIVL